MLKALFVLAFLATTGLYCFPKSQQSHPSKESIAVQKNGDAAAVIGEQDQKSAPPASGIANENYQIQRKLVDGTMMLVVVGLAQALILGLTIYVMILQINANKNQARAWLLVNKVANPPDGLIDPKQPTFIPGIGIQFRVSGETPAKITDYQILLKIVPASQESHLPDLPAIPDYSQAGPKDVTLIGSTRPPGDTFNILLSLASFPSMEQLSDLHNGKTFLCGYGFILYQDVFGRKSKTRFCYIYDFAFGLISTTPDGTRLNPPGFRTGGPESYNCAN
jgi:hypothetical protein